MAQESVFLDFDIIELAFTKDGVETIIPVIMSPMDIVDDITSPAIKDKDISLWQIILGIIALILIIWLLLKFAPVIVYVGGKIILIPFKAVWALFKAIGKSAKKQRQKRKEQSASAGETLNGGKASKTATRVKRKKDKPAKPPGLSGNIKPEEVDKYLESIDWDSVDWTKLDGKSG